MKYPKIDLHMHTLVSDGTDALEEITARVREKGIALFSVTDHDAIKAGSMIPGLLEKGDPDFITGVEFSTRDERGKYHVLGYGYDPASGAIRDVTEEGHRLRMKKVTARLEFLRREFGVSFPEGETEALFGMDNPGKPHIANLMVKYGFAASKETAIREYIDKLRLPNEYLRPEEAIKGILASGGIPVLAHPSYGSGDQLILGEEMEERIRRLKAFGLLGLEGFYSGFSRKLHREILGFAEKFDLYVTAGSDYHGKNKLVSLGDVGEEDGEERPEGLIRFIKDVQIYESPAV